MPAQDRIGQSPEPICDGVVADAKLLLRPRQVDEVTRRVEARPAAGTTVAQQRGEQRREVAAVADEAPLGRTRLGEWIRVDRECRVEHVGRVPNLDLVFAQALRAEAVRLTPVGVHDQPLHEDATVRGIFEIFAGRAAAELRRLRRDAKITTPAVVTSEQFTPQDLQLLKGENVRAFVVLDDQLDDRLSEEVEKIIG